MNTKKLYVLVPIEIEVEDVLFSNKIVGFKHPVIEDFVNIENPLAFHDFTQAKDFLENAFKEHLRKN